MHHHTQTLCKSPLVHGLRAGVAAEGPAGVGPDVAVLDVPVVGPRHPLAAHVLLPRLAPAAVHAGVHDAAHSHPVALLALGNFAAHLTRKHVDHSYQVQTHLGHHARQLVSRHTGVVGVAHVVAGDVDVGVADAAVLQLEGDVMLPRHVPRDVNLGELGVCGGLCPGYGAIHITHCSLKSSIRFERIKFTRAGKYGLS